ncbi:ankyrin repeat protein [Bacteriovorax sp. BSW11_IV]|uniref:ankyrin repeat domain-containing protein n=1 Tax=Bacteriovorax sp. BSW11_IV TaxID=1353529 RepID=UPI00038A4660|nr:ankyrin repeat domain-containing protein [Bacteriovorax sp. BSW11_IV]EQC45191.1 ankyrin repeat protein [Bacteriovorax sp. BSW11_IV]
MFRFVALFLFILQATFAQSLEHDLKKAIISGDIETVRTLVSTTNVDIEESKLFDDTPLRLTIEYNKVEIAKILLTAGANVENNGKYESPLKYAIKYRNLEIIQLLFDHGANVNNSGNGFFPLHLAIFSQIPALVKIILDANPDILNTNGGFSFLEYAATGSSSPNWEIVTMIREATDKALKEREAEKTE